MVSRGCGGGPAGRRGGVQAAWWPRCDTGCITVEVSRLGGRRLVAPVAVGCRGGPMSGGALASQCRWSAGGAQVERRLGARGVMAGRRAHRA